MVPKGEARGIKRECDGRTQAGRLNRSRPRDCRAERCSQTPKSTDRVSEGRWRRKPLKWRRNEPGWTPLDIYESSAFAPPTLREGEGTSDGAISVTPRARKPAIRDFAKGFVPGPDTEVAMATYSMTTSIPLGPSQPDAHAADALPPRIYLNCSASFFDLATARDVSHDCRHAYGFPRR